MATALGPQEFAKIRKPSRAEILIEKINTGQQHKLLKGGSIIIDGFDHLLFERGVNEAQSPTSPSNRTLVNFRFYSQGKEYKLSDLEKSAEYTGGKGSSKGVGGAGTAATESGVAFTIAVVSDRKKLNKSNSLAKNRFSASLPKGGRKPVSVSTQTSSNPSGKTTIGGKTISSSNMNASYNKLKPGSKYLTVDKTQNKSGASIFSSMNSNLTYSGNRSGSFITREPVKYTMASNEFMLNGLIYKKSLTQKTNTVGNRQYYYIGEFFFTEHDAASAKQRVRIDSPIGDVLDFLHVNMDWLESSFLAAHALEKEYSYALNKLVFCRGSKEIKAIERKFNELNIKDRRIFSNINKWNPADIWGFSTTAASSLETHLSKLKSLQEMNEWLLDQIKKNEILPISLKKVEGKQAQLSRVNFDSVRPQHDFDGSTLGKVNYFNSADTFIFYKNSSSSRGQMQIKAFGDKASSVQAEIQGKAARHGKLSRPVMEKYFKKYNSNIELTPTSTIDKIARNIGSAKEIDNMYGYYKTLTHNPIPYQQFVETLQTKDPKWIASKYVGSEILYYLHTLPESKKNNFVTDIMNYAKSQSELSGPFIKIY